MPLPFIGDSGLIIKISEECEITCEILSLFRMVDKFSSKIAFFTWLIGKYSEQLMFLLSLCFWEETNEH